MSRTAVQSFYRYHAAIYDGTRWMILHGRRRAVDMLRLRPDSQVLEIGCGTGLNFSHVLGRLDPQAGRLTGLDFSHAMLAKAERRVASRAWLNVDLLQGDAVTLALGRKFDGILFAYSITMIPDWAAAMRRAFDHLKVGGRMVVIDFGAFAGWGPLGPLVRGWLKLNHVRTQDAYIDEMERIFGRIDVRHWLGGYNFTAAGRKEQHASGD